MQRVQKKVIVWCLALVTVLLSSCHVSNYIPEGDFYLKDNFVTCEGEEKLDKKYLLKDYIAQQPNTKWFFAKVPMYVYTLSGHNPKSWRSKLFHKLGEEPVVYDSLRALKSRNQMRQVLGNAGYLKADVAAIPHVKDKKLVMEYRVIPGERYFIRDISVDIADPHIDSILNLPANREGTLIAKDMPLDINVINEERNRVTGILRNDGFYNFTKEDILYAVDTIQGSRDVNLAVRIKWYVPNGVASPEPHRQYMIRKVNFLPESDGKLHFRKKFLMHNSMVREGELFSENNLRSSYSNFARMTSMAFTSIVFTELKRDSLFEQTDRLVQDSLDVDVRVQHSKPYAIGSGLEATNSAGDLGAAASVTLSKMNLFRGSETLSLKLRGAYEAITGLEGYEGRNYFEIGVEARLSFPTFIFPWVKRDWAVRHGASSEISAQWNIQKRPEFQRRVMTGAWRYKWRDLSRTVQHTFDLLEVNYIYMPWISQTFKEQYLDSLGKRNAILKYNYENLLITKIGYTYVYNSLGAAQQTYGKNAWTMKVNVETAGNVLYGLTSAVRGKQNAYGQYTFCGIAFAQYVKGDFEFAKSIRIDRTNSLAIKAAFGIAYPYGNASQLPFEKRYFAGGANSLRGWSVRSLGPGTYCGADNGINFLNQSGDIKLECSLEYRANLFWKLSGAAFLDAGNIWTIRSYDDQPGGAFRFGTFWQEIALSYGIGLRLNLGFFILRFDGGMKAINPAYKGRDHFPIYHPRFSRDFAFHFAVGLPF